MYCWPNANGHNMTRTRYKWVIDVVWQEKESALYILNSTENRRIKGGIVSIIQLSIIQSKTNIAS